MKFSLVFVPLLFQLSLAGAQTLQTTVDQGAAQADHDAEIRELRQEIDAISARLAVLESQEHVAAAGREAISGSSLPAGTGAPAAATTAVGTEASSAASTSSASKPGAAPLPLRPADAQTLAFFRGTTLSFGLDGYYEYNFNEPIGRVNQLRAYDVSSNSFNINQANLIVEHLPTTAERAGGRIDLQFGQATETLQGSSLNELRPQVWRNRYQAYGSYLAPVGSRLEIDFDKWASALGVEGNYKKDQIAYSRGLMFNYLPFYHIGIRANYTLTSKVNAAYWLVTGANQTEDFNGFKSQAFIFTLKPASTVSWNVNYYIGEEARDVQVNPALPPPPTQPGFPTENINPAPNGREHIFDTYATWNPTPKVTLVGEADFFLNRTYAEQQPSRVAIGAFEFKYALPRNWSVGGRTEYFDDRGGLFSGTTQALKEFTLVTDRILAPGFLVRAEYRCDFRINASSSPTRSACLFRPRAQRRLASCTGGEQSKAVGNWRLPCSM